MAGRWQPVAGGGARMRVVPRADDYLAWIGRVDAHLRAWGTCVDDWNVDARAIYGAWSSRDSALKTARRIVRGTLSW